MKEASIDLETLGTDSDCVILSIGVQLFDFTTGNLGDTFYVKLDKELQFNRTQTIGTIEWWATQDKAVYQEAISGKLALSGALELLTNWLPKGVVAWGNGATFDVSILEHAYKSLGMKIPWQFWKVNDMRTLMRLAKDLSGFDKSSYTFIGDAHNALDDATHQAMLMTEAYNSINGRFSS